MAAKNTRQMFTSQKNASTAHFTYGLFKNGIVYRWIYMWKIIKEKKTVLNYDDMTVKLCNDILKAIVLI